MKANVREILFVVLLAAVLVVSGLSDCEAAGVDDAAVDVLIKIVEMPTPPAERHPLISEQDWTMRKDAVWAWLRAGALEELTARGAKAVGPLMGLVKSAKLNSVKVAALSALSQMKNPADLKPATGLLIELLGNKNPGLRYLAAKTLGGMKVAGAAALIEKLTADPEDRVRAAAADALGSIGSIGSVKPLLVLADYGLVDDNDSDEKKAARLQAVAALGNVGAALEVVPKLVEKLRSDDMNEREVAVEAIDALLGYQITGTGRWLIAHNPQQRAPIIAAFEAWWKKTLATQTFRVANESELTLRVNILAGRAEQPVDVKKRATEVLGKIANPKAVDYLIIAMPADDKDLRKLVAETAKRLSSIHIKYLDADTETAWNRKIDTFRTAWREIRDEMIREWDEARNALTGKPVE